MFILFLTSKLHFYCFQETKKKKILNQYLKKIKSNEEQKNCETSQIQSLFLATFLKLVDANVIIVRDNGSSPLGRGLASQHVCSATLPGSLPACCIVITYELGVEEVDGQDVNTHTYTHTHTHTHKPNNNFQQTERVGVKKIWQSKTTNQLQAQTLHNKVFYKKSHITQKQSLSFNTMTSFH